MRRIFVCAVIAVCSSFTSLQAQLLSINTASQEVVKHSDGEVDWSIFTDSENRMLYVDFEKINVNLSSIMVKDQVGNVLFKDETLWQLPVNTIYEIDFSKYPNGDYTVELKTFTKVIRKQVSIK